MEFSDYLDIDQIELLERLNSQKKVLECLSDLLANQDEILDARTVFARLTEREHLGSTAIGGAIAIPHCRIKKIKRPLAALLKVGNGVEYNAPDEIAVKLFFALVVPEDATQGHLDLLASLANQLNDIDFVNQLLQASDKHDLIRLIKISHERL